MTVKRIVLDTSLSISYQGRAAVGMVRVEREVGKSLVSMDNTGFVRYTNEDCSIRDVSLKNANMLFGDCPPPAEGSATGESFKAMLTESDVLLNCGMPWTSTYLQDVFSLKKKHGFAYAQVIYDLIPVIMPELTPEGMPTAFPRYILDAAWTSDIMFCDSMSTASDLRAYLDRHNAPQPPVKLVRLGVDNPNRFIGSFPMNPLVDLLRGRPFVLFVSTIEPRKNHLMLFEVWQVLSEDLGDDLPILVFVGAQGWNISDSVEIIGESELKSACKIMFAGSVNDETLDWMYKNCLFTVYPSLYEGWGLPVSESIAYSKPFVVSTTSSLPEAAQVGRQIRPHDFRGWVDACRELIVDVEARRWQIAEIKAKRNITSWSDTSVGLIKDLIAHCNGGATAP